MSRIQQAFQEKKAFIPFITCGDPDLETTEKLVYAMEEAGASLIELGIPFSDPTAEGPVIQEASLRALAGGVTTDKILDMVKRIRQKSQIPLVFMTYANVVFSRGIGHFARQAAEAGIDGLILPDVPFEEKDEFDGPCREYGLETPVFEEIGDGVRVILFRKKTESGFRQIELDHENPKSNHESPKSNYENPNLDAKSGYQDFEEVYFTPGNKSERNIQRLYEVIGTSRSFGRNEIMGIINCSKSTAANLLNEMKNKNFIRKVKGRGKYVFDKQLHILQ